VSVVIRVLSVHDVGELDRIDGGFLVDSELVVSITDGAFGYRIVPVLPYSKRYPSESVDYAAYLDQPDRIIFVAVVEESIAGLIRLARSWNGFAAIEDLAVDAKHRRREIGRRLMLRACEWALQLGVRGISAETQTNNVAACQFYECCGFELSGFDRRFYAGLSSQKAEAAVFWYLMFDA